jgi:hypothetical protein
MPVGAPSTSDIRDCDTYSRLLIGRMILSYSLSCQFVNSDVVTNDYTHGGNGETHKEQARCGPPHQIWKKADLDACGLSVQPFADPTQSVYQNGPVKGI